MDKAETKQEAGDEAETERETKAENYISFPVICNKSHKKLL